MSGLAEKNVRTSRTFSGLALFKSASPMDYQSIKSAVHPATMLQIKFIFELKLNFKMQSEGGTLQNVSIVRQ